LGVFPETHPPLKKGVAACLYAEQADRPADGGFTLVENLP
jgi:hypothetical protein